MLLNLLIRRNPILWFHDTVLNGCWIAVLFVFYCFLFLRPATLPDPAHNSSSLTCLLNMSNVVAKRNPPPRGYIVRFFGPLGLVWYPLTSVMAPISAAPSKNKFWPQILTLCFSL